MRVSSVMRPPSSGTLKSTRRKTRFPPKSSRSTVCFATATLVPGTALERPGHVADQVTHAAGVAPLVVVPGQHLHEIAVDDGRRWQIHDRRVWVAVEVHGHQLFIGRVEDPLERPGGSA